MFGWNPSYDFRLFDVGWISPLQANEFGAQTMFRASDPTAFVDYSLNQLGGLLNPRAAYPFVQRQIPASIEEVPFQSFFQSPSGRDPIVEAQLEADRARREFERARDEYERTQGRRGINILDILRGRTVRSGEGTGPILGSGANQPGDASVGDDPAQSGQKVGGAIAAAQEFLKALPEGSGVFLIAVAALIFILLFVRR